MSGPSRPFNARFSRDVLDRLERQVSGSGLPKSRLAERYVDEGLRMDGHPGIVFRDGPAGRRAGLAAGPDVWEVIAVVNGVEERGDAAVAATAAWLGLTPAQVRTAVGYYAEFPEEVDARIRRNEGEAEEAEAAWRRQQAALA